MPKLKVSDLPKIVNGINTVTLLIGLGLEALQEIMAAQGLSTDEALAQAEARYHANSDAIDELASRGHENDP